MIAVDGAAAPGGASDAGHPFDLADLGDALSRSALAEFVACFDPLGPRRADWERHRGQAPPAMQPLIDLFLLSRQVEEDRLPHRIQVMLAELSRLGLVVRANGLAAMADGLVVLPVFGRWLLCQPPQVVPEFYFGDDTLALLTRLSPRAKGRCLDLCTGPGTLALHAAGICDHVTAVESVPRSAQLARLNMALNRVSHRVEVMEGDLYAPVRGRLFDSVVANPPMLPYPPALTGPSIGHGGEDGFRVTMRILAGLPDALSQDGAAQIIGTCLSDGVMPLGVDRLQAAAGDRIDLTLSVMSHQSLHQEAPLWDALVATVAAASKEDKPIVRAAYAALLERAHASHLCHLFLHACHGNGQLRLIDLADANRGGIWRLRG